MKTSEGAAGLAALVHWVPGFVQAMEPRSRLSMLIELADDLEIRTDGRVVSISFVFQESKLKELRDLIAKQTKE